LESRKLVGTLAVQHGCKRIAITDYSAVLNDFKGPAYFLYQAEAKAALEKLK
jgi:hypothetical protein